MRLAMTMPAPATQRHPPDLMPRTEPRPRRSGAGACTDSIEIENVGKVFRTRSDTVVVEALRDVSFAVPPGQFVSFVGPSGCGKSTLLKLIGGLIEPSSGRIAVGGREVKGTRRDIGMMFQTPVLFPWRTVIEHVMLPIEIFGLARRRHTASAMDILHVV